VAVAVAALVAAAVSVAAAALAEALALVVAMAVALVVVTATAASTSADRVAGGTPTPAFASARIIDVSLIGVSTYDRQQELGCVGQPTHLLSGAESLAVACD
jgi:hypothetical protein